MITMKESVKISGNEETRKVISMKASNEMKEESENNERKSYPSMKMKENINENYENIINNNESEERKRSVM